MFDRKRISANSKSTKTFLGKQNDVIFRASIHCPDTVHHTGLANEATHPMGCTMILMGAGQQC